MIYRLMFVFLICCSLPVMAQESTPKGSPPLTPDEAINLAQANNRQVKNTILTAAIDEEQIQVNPELQASTSIQKGVSMETYESDFARPKPKS